MMDFYLVFILLVIMLNHNACQDSIAWDHHVYTGRHLDDYITASKFGPPNVYRNALFVMYTPECEEQVDALKVKELPLEKFMMFVKHDYKTFPKAVWYQLDERDDLVHRYKPESCLKIMYFRNGSIIHNPEVYDEREDVNVLNWVWNKMKIKFTVVNNRNEAILLKFSGWRGDETSPNVVLGYRESGTFYTFLSHSVSMFSASNGLLLFLKLVNADFPNEIAVNEDISYPHKSSLEVARQEVRRESALIHHFHKELSHYYLMCFNQVRSLPRFTAMGYKKTRIPVALFRDIQEFYYSQGAALRRNESKDPVADGLAINYYDTMCTIVQLSREMVQRIADVLGPIEEEWCKHSLVQTYIYGIREYYNRNVLRRHVDRIDTHVISAILQIHKDLDDGVDWPLEIVGMDGHVRQIYLEPGDMLLYESTTLIHGRPSPFQGKVYANIFAHFKPTNWQWKIEDKIITNKGKAVCNVDKLYKSDVKSTASDPNVVKTEL